MRWAQVISVACARDHISLWRTGVWPLVVCCVVRNYLRRWRRSRIEHDHHHWLINKYNDKIIDIINKMLRIFLLLTSNILSLHRLAHIRIWHAFSRVHQFFLSQSYRAFLLISVLIPSKPSISQYNFCFLLKMEWKNMVMSCRGSCHSISQDRRLQGLCNTFHYA